MPGTSEHTAALERFHAVYGLTLAMWAHVENKLGHLFAAITGLALGPRGMAPALFFSGRSFATRSDLLLAAVRTSDRPEHQRDLYRAIIKKARQYSAARNAMAHGIPIWLVGASDYRGMAIKEGDAIWDEAGITEEQLNEAKTNFIRLHEIVSASLDTRLSEEQCKLRLEQIAALPSTAFSA